MGTGRLTFGRARKTESIQILKIKNIKIFKNTLTYIDHGILNSVPGMLRESDRFYIALLSDSEDHLLVGTHSEFESVAELSRELLPLLNIVPPQSEGEVLSPWKDPCQPLVYFSSRRNGRWQEVSLLACKLPGSRRRPPAKPPGG